MTEDLLQWYLKRISPESQPLTSQEERELVIKAKAGDKQALDKLIMANLRFVITLAKVYANDSVPLTELISAGNEGLMEALRRFDLSKNVRFLTYAGHWIKFYIRQELTNQHVVSISKRDLSHVNKFKKLYNKLYNELEREPTEEELLEEAHRQGLSAKELSQLITYSLDEQVLDRWLFKHAQEETEEEPSREDLKEELNKYLECLTDIERKALSLRYGLEDGIERSYGELSKMLNLPKAKVKYLVDRALKKLRKQAIKEHAG